MSKKNIISLIGLVGSLALIFFLIRPFWFSIKLLKTELTSQKEEIVKVEELLVKTEQLKQDYQEIEDEAEKISLALPEEKDIPYLLVQFESLAKNNGLLLESISFTQVSQEAERVFNLNTLAADIKLTGSYEAFKNYLTNLENNIRLMEVYSISFGLSQGSKEAMSLANLGIFEFELGVNVYYLGEQ